MESSLQENPADVKLWLTLARYHLKDYTENTSDKSALEKALAVLSKSLELNRDSEELWIEYLSLFAKNSSADELRELSYQAVMYGATYNVWWTCLNLEKSVLGKQEICTEMIKFIIEVEEDKKLKSHKLTETLLYLCKLLEAREHHKLMYHCLLAALGIGKVEDKSKKLMIANLEPHLTKNDLAILWICFLSVKCFHCLPKELFAMDESGPGRLVNKTNFVLDWSRLYKITVDEARSTFHGKLLYMGNYVLCCIDIICSRETKNCVQKSL